MGKAEIPVLPEHKWPKERRYKASARTWQGFFQALLRAAYETVGEEKTIEIVRKWGKSLAAHLTEKALEAYDLKGNDAHTAALWVALGAVVFDSALKEERRIEIIQESPNKCVLKWYPPCSVLSGVGTPAQWMSSSRLCKEGLCHLDYAAVKAINPKLKVTFTKMIPDGDPYCEEIIELVE